MIMKKYLHVKRLCLCSKNNQDLKRLEEDEVISFSTYADFSSDSELSNYIKSLDLIRKTR